MSIGFDSINLIGPVVAVDKKKYLLLKVSVMYTVVDNIHLCSDISYYATKQLL